MQSLRGRDEDWDVFLWIGVLRQRLIPQIVRNVRWLGWVIRQGQLLEFLRLRDGIVKYMLKEASTASSPTPSFRTVGSHLI